MRRPQMFHMWQNVPGGGVAAAPLQEIPRP